MSKEEFLKIQTCVLKVNIHCDGCKRKVKKILQKIDGVYTTNIDSEQGKVTVSGNIDPDTLIKKLAKSGKHADICGAPKGKQNQPNNDFKNLQIDNGKGGNSKGQSGQKGGNNQPKGGQIGQLGQGLNPQQLQQLKALQDMKMPQMKDFKIPPFNPKDQNQKSVKFNLPEDDDLSDDEYDEYDDDDEDDDFDDDELDDDMEDLPPNKMKPLMGNPQGMPNMMMNGQHPQLMKGAPINGGGIGKKGGGGNIPVQVNMGGGNIGGGGGGKKGGNGNSQNGGGSAQKGGNSGGGQPQENKKGGGGGNGGGGGQKPNGNHGGGSNGLGNINGNGAKKGGGMNDELHGMPNMMSMNAGGSMGQMRDMPMGQMGNAPMGQMGNLAAVQGLPASPGLNGASMGGGGGYFQGGGGGAGAGPEMMPNNPYYQQQQLAAMMMNQQRANGNERFQPMMYARPPPAVNYLPPYPSYAYPPPGEPYHHAFDDENTSSCNVM